MAFEWLEAFQHRLEKPPDYAERTLAAYALGIRAKGSIVGVLVERGDDCCPLAAGLPAGKVYLPEDAPRLPLAGCPQGRRCGCVYRPVMRYEQTDDR